MFPELKFSEEEILRRIAAATPETVAGSLAKERRDFFDLLNLFSPAAMTMTLMALGMRLTPSGLRAAGSAALRPSASQISATGSPAYFSSTSRGGRHCRG